MNRNIKFFVIYIFWNRSIDLDFRDSENLAIVWKQGEI